MGRRQYKSGSNGIVARLVIKNRAYLMIYVRTNSSASSKGQARSLVVRSLDHELGGQATLVSSWFNLSEDLESKYVMEVLSVEV